jgi:transcription-repair coupling factor (superfamily II helicase)
MYIKHDYHLTNEALIKKGYAELSVHSLNLDRYFNEEEQAENRKLSHELTSEQWNERCNRISEYMYHQLSTVIDQVKNNYNIHQLTEETSTTEHFRSDWDLFFWSNCGWNGKQILDTFSLTFNEKRSAAENMRLLNELLAVFEQLSIKNVSCRVQYTAIRNEEKIEADGETICKQLEGQFINYNGWIGKIKTVGEKYGFFKKGAKNHYYSVPYEYLVMNFGETL